MMFMILLTEAPAATWGDLLPVVVPLVLLCLVAAVLGGGRSR